MKRNDYPVSRSDYKLYPFDVLTEANIIRRDVPFRARPSSRSTSERAIIHDHGLLNFQVRRAIIYFRIANSVLSGFAILRYPRNVWRPIEKYVREKSGVLLL